MKKVGRQVTLMGSPDGIQYMGMHLLADAYQQATQGTTWLIFCRRRRQAIWRSLIMRKDVSRMVGMLLNDHEIIHASGKVRVDPIDNQELQILIPG